MENGEEYGFFHAMKQEEDIFLLAELYYGDASLWWVIYHANLEKFGDDPEYTKPGLEIFIPYIEVKELEGKVPGFIARKASDCSSDPMVLLAIDSYQDPTMCFAIYEKNGWEPDRVPETGEAIIYPFRASRPNMRRAERWRSIFYQE